VGGEEQTTMAEVQARVEVQFLGIFLRVYVVGRVDVYVCVWEVFLFAW